MSEELGTCEWRHGVMPGQVFLHKKLETCVNWKPVPPSTPAGASEGPTKGTLEVGTFEGEVIVNHPDLDPDKNGVGHIVFSPDEARNLARILLKQADIAEGK